jgi:hypothetical protein
MPVLIQTIQQQGLKIITPQIEKNISTFATPQLKGEKHVPEKS